MGRAHCRAGGKGIVMIDNLHTLVEETRSDWKHAWKLRAALQALMEHMTVDDLLRLADTIAVDRNGR